MGFLPVFLNLSNRHCLIVGGNSLAASRYRQLVECNARVKVVSESIGEELRRTLRDPGEYSGRAFAESDLDGDPALVVACSGNAELDQRIADDCDRRGIPVNIAGDKSRCSFVFPSVIARSPLKIAISTSGESPILSRLARMVIESLIPSNFGSLARLIDRHRDRLQHSGGAEQQKQFWDDVLHSPVAELMYSGRSSEAESVLNELAEKTDATRAPFGEVYLVGAGPGDPDLLTLRALRLIKKSEVVFYDRLVSAAIMDMLPSDAERIYVGKQRARHAVPQESINDLLVRHARSGKRVLRLKGGDPFIFGRGGEEIETLVEENVVFQVVPGITAASGCASYAGIPLTHRDHSQACIFVTGHLKDGSVDLNWSMLAHADQTVVFYMGLQGVAKICEELIRHGRDATTPAALVEKGTTPDQKVVIGSLDSLPALVASHAISAPTLIIVGEVVSLHEKLHWFTEGTELTE